VPNQTLPAGFLFENSPPALAVLTGNRRLKAERLLAFELGYRLRPRAGLFLDVAGFHNTYRGLRTGELGLPYLADEPLPVHLVAILKASNLVDGETYGLEATADWQGWRPERRLRFGYTYLHMDLRSDPTSNPLATVEDGRSPSHQLFFWPSWEPREGVELDGVLRYVGPLDSHGIDSHLGLNLRLGWSPWPALGAALVGRNLLDSRHPEFGETVVVNTAPTETQRDFYLALTWRF
jgi:iron complex outermembrane recepter protein